MDQKNVIHRPLKTAISVFLLILLNSCIEKDTVFEITDLTKPQRFTYITRTNHWEAGKIVTVQGNIKGCSEIAYFYGAEWDTTYLADKTMWPKNTFTINDSISKEMYSEEGDGTKHDFFFLPGDATKGKITIRIHTFK